MPVVVRGVPKSKTVISVEFWSSLHLQYYPSHYCILPFTPLHVLFSLLYYCQGCECSLYTGTRAVLVNVAYRKLTHVVRYFRSVPGRGPRVRGNMTHFPRLPPGQFATRFVDFFFRALSRGKRGGKRKMEIEKLEKGERRARSTARYALSACRYYLRRPRQSPFFFSRLLFKNSLSSHSETSPMEPFPSPLQLN